MDWLFFAIISALVWSVTGIMDKYLVDKKVKNPLIITVFVRISYIIPVILILPFVAFSLPRPDFIVWIFFAAVLSNFGAILFYKSISIEEISKAMPLFQLIPVFILFMSFLFLGELLRLFDYAGFLAIVIGGLVISAKDMRKLFRVQKIFLWVVLSSLMFAGFYVTMKYVSANVDYWSSLLVLWSFQAAMISSLLLSKNIWKETSSCFRNLSPSLKMLILIDSLFAMMAFVFNYLAINLGPVTLVEAAGNVELIFIFLLALAFTRFSPSVIKENFDRAATGQKILGMLLIISGVLLLQLF